MGCRGSPQAAHALICTKSTAKGATLQRSMGLGSKRTRWCHSTCIFQWIAKTDIPSRASLAGCAAGVEFLLPHLLRWQFTIRQNIIARPSEACAMWPSTTSRCETQISWLLFASVTVAPARFAMERCASGGIILLVLDQRIRPTKKLDFEVIIAQVPSLIRGLGPVHYEVVIVDRSCLNTNKTR